MTIGNPGQEVTLPRRITTHGHALTILGKDVAASDTIVTAFEDEDQGRGEYGRSGRPGQSGAGEGESGRPGEPGGNGGSGPDGAAAGPVSPRRFGPPWACDDPQRRSLGGQRRGRWGRWGRRERRPGGPVPIGVHRLQRGSRTRGVTVGRVAGAVTPVGVVSEGGAASSRYASTWRRPKPSSTSRAPVPRAGTAGRRGYGGAGGAGGPEGDYGRLLRRRGTPGIEWGRRRARGRGDPRAKRIGGTNPATGCR